MSRNEISADTVGYPMPVTLLGTLYRGRPNFMALSWVTRVDFDPPLIGVAVYRNHASAHGILENRCFGISVPTTDQIVPTDYTGLVSGTKRDKSSVFPVTFGELASAPMVADCPVAMECRLVDSLELTNNTFFVGEVVTVYADNECLVEGAVDLARTHPFLLSLPDNGYWTLGQRVGRAWSDGRDFDEAEAP